MILHGKCFRGILPHHRNVMKNVQALHDSFAQRRRRLRFLQLRPKIPTLALFPQYTHHSGMGVGVDDCTEIIEQKLWCLDEILNYIEIEGFMIIGAIILMIPDMQRTSWRSVQREATPTDNYSSRSIFAYRPTHCEWKQYEHGLVQTEQIFHIYRYSFLSVHISFACNFIAHFRWRCSTTTTFWKAHNKNIQLEMQFLFYESPVEGAMQ